MINDIIPSILLINIVFFGINDIKNIIKNNFQLDENSPINIQII